MKLLHIRNSYGFVISVGCTVQFHCARDGKDKGTVKSIDRTSDFARAYGPQISFSDSPYTVTPNDCFSL